MRSQAWNWVHSGLECYYWWIALVIIQVFRYLRLFSSKSPRLHHSKIVEEVLALCCRRYHLSMLDWKSIKDDHVLVTLTSMFTNLRMWKNCERSVEFPWFYVGLQQIKYLSRLVILKDIITCAQSLALSAWQQQLSKLSRVDELRW